MLDVLDIPGVGKIEATIIDVSNPLVLVRAGDVGLNGTELPDEVNANAKACEILEKVRGTTACMMGIAKDLRDATDNSPAVPKVGFFAAPARFTDIAGKPVDASKIDMCVRVISVFKCHKASPLTAAKAISVMASIIAKTLGKIETETVRIGHPSGTMSILEGVIDIHINSAPDIRARKMNDL